MVVLIGRQVPSEVLVVAVLLPDACQAFVVDRRRSGARIVFTEGIFDLLHPGHVGYLSAARALGDVLVVGVISDRSTAATKEHQRPIVNGAERAELVAALAAVDAVTILDAVTPTGMIDLLRPDIVVTGADASAVEIVDSGASKVVHIPVHAGWSSAAILAKVRSSR